MPRGMRWGLALTFAGLLLPSAIDPLTNVAVLLRLLLTGAAIGVPMLIVLALLIGTALARRRTYVLWCAALWWLGLGTWLFVMMGYAIPIAFSFLLAALGPALIVRAVFSELPKAGR